MKILSVDDSKMVHMVVTRTLKPLGIDIVTASNGEEGVAAARAEKPDLILLDATMPVMDGLEALAKLKADAETKDIPVIMLSADSCQTNRDQASSLGALNFISKPFTGDSLLAGIKEHVALPSAA